MIGKISIGKDFGGCISYILEGTKGEKKKFAEILKYNNCYGNKNELIEQFRDVKALNQRIEKPVWHTSLSFSQKDIVEKKHILEIIEKFAKTFGFEENQYLAVQHHDTRHKHVHIVCNRVCFDGKSISTSKNYKKISEFSRTIEKEYNLEQVLSPKKFLDKEYRNKPRFDNRKNEIKKIVKESLSRSKSLEDFKNLLKNNNIKTEIGRGIAFIDNKGVRLKGSQIGFSLKKVKDILSKQLNRKPELINKKLITKNLNYER